MTQSRVSPATGNFPPHMLERLYDPGVGGKRDAGQPVDLPEVGHECRARWKTRPDAAEAIASRRFATADVLAALRRIMSYELTSRG
jgi:hypothetical protein